MSDLTRRRFVSLLALALATPALGQGAAPTAPTLGRPKSRLPLPLVQPGSTPGTPFPGSAPGVPGAVQPLAPGERLARPLPQLSLSPPLPGLLKLEYASNGSAEAAHAIVLVETDPGAERVLDLAQQAAARSYATRPSLDDVTVSVYLSAGYAGFGGPPPLLTASVPPDRLAQFGRLNVAGLDRYERAWRNPAPSSAAPPKPARELERTPIFEGSPAELGKQRVQQLAAQETGGPRGGLFFHGDASQPTAALTFDDAPHPIYAPLLLDTLRRAGVQATFFCIGRNAYAYPYFVRDFVDAGHEVGNHTYHHVRLPGLSEAQVRAELRDTSALLGALTGRPVRYFRPPGGRYSPLTLRVAEELGLTTTFWTDDPGDFDNLGQRRLVSRLDQRLRQGGLVLLHDNVLQSVVVLPRFVSYARRAGVRLETVGRLAGASEK